jgi:hypothetical protein
VTIASNTCRKVTMQNRTRFTRLALTGLGVWTVLLSFIVMFRATELHAWQDDALSGISIAVLLLGMSLALGGGCLALRGVKYRGRATNHALQ